VPANPNREAGHFQETMTVAKASTVPVALDSTAPTDGVDELVRIIYFRITAEDPNTPMFFQSGTAAFPFILLGLEGIVLGPATNEDLFQSPQDIDELIDLIEATQPARSHEPLAFETSSLWLPFGALQRSKSQYLSRAEQQDVGAERGDVFRLSPDAFRKAWWFFDGRIVEASLRDFFNSSESTAVVYSPIETKAFRKWSQAQLGGQAQLGMNTP
jgi:hypothetical protein